MDKRLVLIRAIGPEDWRAVKDDIAIGTMLYQYTGHDYGCVRDDATYGNKETIACTLVKDELPFFTVPVEFLRYYETSEQPQGQYLTRESWEKIKNLQTNK